MVGLPGGISSDGDGSLMTVLLWGFKSESFIQLAICLAVLSGLVAVAAYVMGKIRAEPVQQEPKASELLSKFRESHGRGELSDEEFRTIRTTLEPRLKEELRDNGPTG